MNVKILLKRDDVVPGCQLVHVEAGSRSEYRGRYSTEEARETGIAMALNAAASLVAKGTVDTGMSREFFTVTVEITEE